MQIILNEYNYIIGYVLIGGVEGGINIDIGLKEDMLDHQYIDGKLVYNPIPKVKPQGINIQYDGKRWVEKATLQEQADYWLEEIKRLSRELAIASIDMMVNSDPIHLKLNKACKKHEEISHEIALSVEKDM